MRMLALFPIEIHANSEHNFARLSPRRVKTSALLGKRCSRLVLYADMVCKLRKPGQAVAFLLPLLALLWQGEPVWGVRLAKWMTGASAPKASEENASLAAASLEPHFTGFDGTRFAVDGEDGQYYNLLTHSYYTVNARFRKATLPDQEYLWMSEIAVVFHNNVTIESKLTNEALVFESQKNGSGHDLSSYVLKNVSALCTVEVNGVSQRGYIGRNLVLELGEVSLFLPAVSIANNTISDGTIVLLKTKHLEIAVMIQTKGAVHLDFAVRLTSPDMWDIHGLLGQSMHWNDQPAGDVLQLHPSEFLLDSLLQTNYTHSSFGAAPRRRSAITQPVHANRVGHTAGNQHAMAYLRRTRMHWNRRRLEPQYHGHTTAGSSAAVFLPVNGSANSTAAGGFSSTFMSAVKRSGVFTSHSARRRGSALRLARSKYSDKLATQNQVARQDKVAGSTSAVFVINFPTAGNVTQLGAATGTQGKEAKSTSDLHPEAKDAPPLQAKEAKSTSDLRLAKDAPPLQAKEAKSTSDLRLAKDAPPLQGKEAKSTSGLRLTKDAPPLQGKEAKSTSDLRLTKDAPPLQGKEAKSTSDLRLAKDAPP